jgi:hypothetical protein
MQKDYFVRWMVIAIYFAVRDDGYGWVDFLIVFGFLIADFLSSRGK